jgi:methyl-accepting chemotaxis protein
MRRFIWVFLSALLFFIALSCFIYFQSQATATFNQTRDRLILIASNSALSISADEIFNIPLEDRSEGSPEYLTVYQKLLKIKEANPAVKYAYIMTSTNQPGILKYVVDADPVPQIITAKCPTALPGDKYDASRFPEMLEGFERPSADKKISFDEWGMFISGYAPITDINGRTVAILGVDIDASNLKTMQNQAHFAGQAALFMGILSFIILGFSFAKPR